MQKGQTGLPFYLRPLSSVRRTCRKSWRTQPVVIEFVRKGLVDLAPAGIIRIIEDAAVATTVVQPAGVIKDGIRTHTFNRHAGFNCETHLRRNKSKPTRTVFCFDTGFGDKYRSPITLIKLPGELMKRTILRMKGVESRTIVDPFVIVV